LYKNPVIRFLSAALLLVLFAFSITPKKSLHDVLTNHKDQTHKAAAAGTHELSKAGFNCKCDNLVAESPFTPHQQTVELFIPQYFSTATSSLAHHYYFSSFFFFEHRGPPASC